MVEALDNGDGEKSIRLLLESGVKPAGDRKSRGGLVVVDTVGVGGGVADTLKDMGFRVREYKAGRSSRRGKKFFNRRAESYWHLRELLEGGEIRLLEHERLFVELVGTEWGTDPAGRVKLESKEKLRDRLGHSPDFADAVAMLHDEFRNPIGPNLPPVYW